MNLGFKEKLANALFGTAPEVAEVAPQMSYGANIDNFLNSLPQQAYAKGLYNQPAQVGLAPEQIREGVANGLSYGIPQIAEQQQKLGIRIPETEEEMEQARLGQFNQPGLAVGGVSQLPRQGGLIKDFTSGFNENLMNKYNPTNLEPSNKGLATRIGEGLGTLTRFADSPLGRALLAYGLSNAVGDTNAVEQGLQAAVGRQQMRTADQAYRHDILNTRLNSLYNSYDWNTLSDEEKRAREQEVFDEINGIKGNITGDIYGNMLKAQLERNDSDYRKMYYDTQNRNNADAMAYRILEAQRNINQDKMDNYFKQQEINQGWSKIQNEAKEKQEKNNPWNKMTTTERKDIINGNQSLADIQRGLQEINANPNAYSFIKGVLPADVTNRLDPGGLKARTTIDNITAVYRKWLTGAQMSDQERKSYERFLPAPTDNYQIIKTKLKGMQDSIQAHNNEIYKAYNMTGDEFNTSMQPQATDSLGIL